jgi:pyrroline-5-carboxylate reductase
VLKANVLPRESVAVVEPVPQRREQLSGQLNIAVAAAIEEAPPAAQYVLAVKPQQIDAVLGPLAAAIGPEGALVISIAAGISTTFLAAALGEKARIVRAMPNTPMLVGQGCTGMCRGPGATDDDLAFARRLFASGGEVFVVDESAIDAVTAVSGSGPAYFFYLIEAMVAAGVAEGLDEDTALALARQTCTGAAALLAQPGEKPAALRARVTSPGGTTQAALAILDAAGVADTLIQAVRAAAHRSRQLRR